ncbi:alpha/beta hydrolase-fold protein [Undibacterium cyanobacteriorum]|uniref:Alpha/beta hydrolase-fold protein n=1 Tax=Undibacterium cyanobacteriorum TaxID=3073561 RepID=A0ABY9RK33_9BURK|nr:alpha/beta hydrolase-fold protein [Undibacterium sp. 20NA77.5]WMW81569.1 alpha/beta hydrolase-fold protein [Undibacterium sp. 20NA77.5]
MKRIEWTFALSALLFSASITAVAEAIPLSVVISASQSNDAKGKLGKPMLAATETKNKQALSIGDSYVLTSKLMQEERRINVMVPDVYQRDPHLKLPVIYMLDGGLKEDFLHIAGLMQVSIDNGTMRPFILVGIENTVRRRDLTGPSDNALDKRDIPNLGGAPRFREFLLKEAIPFVEQAYRVTDERALVGESLAGLFTLETLFYAPDAFQTFIAIDPSLWWNDQKLTAAFSEKLKLQPRLAKKVYFASSGQAGMEKVISAFANVLEQTKPEGLQWTYEKFPAETHATIYHPAALKAFRLVFAPPAKQ